jgi:hypothetical protein
LLYASIKRQGRDRFKVAAPYSAFSEYARSHRRPRREEEELLELLEVRAEVVEDQGQVKFLHGHLTPGRHPAHPARRGGPLVLRDEAHPVRISIQQEEEVVVHDRIRHDPSTSASPLLDYYAVTYYIFWYN